MRIAGIVIFVVGLSFGCADKQAAQRAQKQVQFESAVSLVARAEQGYRPVDDQNKLTHATLDLYQRAKLAEAITELESVAKSPSPKQRVSAQLLLADLQASASRVALRDGLNAWADLANRSAELVQYLIAIDRAQARGMLLSTDDGPLIQKLQADRDQERSQISVLQVTREKLEKNIKSLKTKITDLDTQRGDIVTEAQQYREQAFVKSGDQRYDLYDQASQSDRKAFQLGSDAQRHHAILDVYESELNVLNRRVESGNNFIESVESQIADTQLRRKESQASAAQAQNQEQELVKKLGVLVDQLAADFDTHVDVNLNKALEKIDLAITHAQSAVEDADADSESARLELLGKNVTKVHVLSSQVLTTGDLGRTLTIISKRAGATRADGQLLIPEHAKSLDNSVRQIATRQGKTIAITMASLDQAVALAGEMAASADPSISEDASSYLDQLNGYRARINELRLPGAQVPSSDQGTDDAEAASQEPESMDDTSISSEQDSTSNTAEQAMRDLLVAISEHRADNIWDMMPASYQNDLTDLLHTSAQLGDAELWDASFKILGKLSRVLEEKKDLILQLPILQQMPDTTELENAWPHVVGLIKSVADSDIADMKKVETLDIRSFLAQQVPQFFKHIDALAALSPVEPMKISSLDESQVKVVSADETSAQLLVTVPGQSERPVNLTLVQGRWVPSELAQQWQQNIEKSKAQLEAQAASQDDESKQQTLAMLNMVDAQLDQLLKVDSPEQFGAQMTAIMGMIMAQAMQFQQGMGGGMPPGIVPQPQ